MLLIRLISYLPFPLLWVLSDITYFIVYRVIRYRKDVVRSNLKKCFPSKTREELIQVEVDFYRRFSDYFFETLKCLTISEKELNDRVIFKGDGLNKINNINSKIVFCSHLFNWEICGLAFGNNIDSQLFFSYQKLSGNFADNLIQKIRCRFGNSGVERHLMASKIKKGNSDNLIFYILGDQTPVGKAKKYWTQFLGQETAFYYGIGQLAVISKFPVFFFKPIRTGRGRYSVELIELSKSENASGYLDEYINELENHLSIYNSQWLWSHKRWKAGRGPRDIYSDTMN